MSAGRFIEQEHVAALIADYSGMARDNIPATRVEAAGASGGLALRQGYMAVASGMHDIVVVGGAEKMTDVGDTSRNEIQSSAADQQWEVTFGATFPSLHAMIARRHMHDFGTTREQIASVAVKNHKHGSLNPKAQFQKEIRPGHRAHAPRRWPTRWACSTAPRTPTERRRSCSAPWTRRSKYTDTPVKILASAQASDTLALHHRSDITSFDATRSRRSARSSRPGWTPKDIQLAEVHDNFTISEILAIEDLGFFPKGEGGKATVDGQIAIGGKIAINTSGGLKARGDPIGATGVAQIVEVVTQLRGTGRKAPGGRRARSAWRRTSAAPAPRSSSPYWGWPDDDRQVLEGERVPVQPDRVASAASAARSSSRRGTSARPATASPSGRWSRSS